MNKYLKPSMTLALMVAALNSPGLQAQEQPEPPRAPGEVTGQAVVSPEAESPAPPQAAQESTRREAYAIVRAARAEASRSQTEALELAEAEQRQALEAVEMARKELARQAEERARLARDQSEARQHEQLNQRETLRVEREEMRKIERDLQRAHESLRKASREVERVHREVSRPPMPPRPSPPSQVKAYSFSTGGRAVVGLILDQSGDDGIRVLGVSPDGPAERAGVRPGDVLVAIMDESLEGLGNTSNSVLDRALADLQAGDELDISVKRGGEVIDYTVTAEQRKPFTWHSFSRLSSQSMDGDAPVVISERIEVPDIDLEALDGELARLHEEYEFLVADGDVEYRFGPGDFDVDVQAFSDFGHSVINGTNIWFGMSLTRGLKLAEINPGLGEYFGTDRGVLVLEAEADNQLQLETGDVILELGGQAVSRPADLMRAMRELESGQNIQLAIKRDKKNRNLDVTVPDQRSGYHYEWVMPDALAHDDSHSQPGVQVKVIAPDH